jgi:hypothetical protein
MARSKNFYEAYSTINHEWFRSHGLNPDHMRVVLSLTCGGGGFAASVIKENPEATIVYGSVSDGGSHSATIPIVIHEYSHAVGNPIALKWYTENEQFRIWSDSSVNIERFPFYRDGLYMAFEYVSRAMTILYLIENQNGQLARLLLEEKLAGFPYTQEVFAMLTDHEMIDLEGDIIRLFLGVDYKLSDEEHRFEHGDMVLRWRMVDLFGYELALEHFHPNSVGNQFNTETGDVFVLIEADNTALLYIDLGETLFNNRPVRSYYVIRLGYVSDVLVQP